MFAIAFMLIFSCSNPNRSNIEAMVDDVSQTDDYAVLRETNPAPKRIEEDLSGNLIVLSEKDFIERITAIDNPKGFQYKGQTPCIVEIYADWCRPCEFQNRIMLELAPKYKGKVIFYKINTDKAYGVADAFKVTNIPMILYFKPHGKVSTSVGYLNREQLEKMINDLLL